MDAQKFGAFIAQCRKEKGMTQSDLAAKIMVTDKAVSRCHRGGRAYMKAPVPRPTLRLVDKVSRSCGHTPGKAAGQRATVKTEMNGFTPSL